MHPKLSRFNRGHCILQTQKIGEQDLDLDRTLPLLNTKRENVNLPLSLSHSSLYLFIYMISAGSKNKVMSMVEQFNLRSSKSVDSQQRFSLRDVKITAPVITPPVERLSNGHASSPPPPDSTWKTSPLYRSSDSDDEDVPEMIKRLSDSAFLGQRSSDTLSSDIIVNSISTGKLPLYEFIVVITLSLSPPSELEGLEQQLALAREEVQRYKKAARLWKNRYEQEHRAR